MTQPEGDRILAVRACQFVDKGLDRKNVALAAKRAQRGGAYRHGEQAMAFDLPRWKIVERYRVAIGATAISLRRVGGDVAWARICQFGRRRPRRPCRASRPGTV